MAKEKEFTCVITDLQLKDRFSAEVSIYKKTTIERTRQKDGKLELAHIYITPVSGNLHKIHNHFVLYNYVGEGLYIVRDRFGNEIARRQCEIWDLGHSFAIKVFERLKTLV